ncbi:Chitin synthase, class 2 [Chytridiales sp. JEL 0842]|nr:Chitin synthase, class 2 [Chytridiales sp. JEL 0842]
MASNPGNREEDVEVTQLEPEPYYPHPQHANHHSPLLDHTQTYETYDQYKQQQQQYPVQHQQQQYPSQQQKQQYPPVNQQQQQRPQHPQQAFVNPHAVRAYSPPNVPDPASQPKALAKPVVQQPPQPVIQQSAQPQPAPLPSAQPVAPLPYRSPSPQPKAPAVNQHTETYRYTNEEVIEPPAPIAETTYYAPAPIKSFTPQPPLPSHPHQPLPPIQGPIPIPPPRSPSPHPAVKGDSNSVSSSVIPGVATTQIDTYYPLPRSITPQPTSEQPYRLQPTSNSLPGTLQRSQPPQPSTSPPPPNDAALQAIFPPSRAYTPPPPLGGNPTPRPDFSEPVKPAVAVFETDAIQKTVGFQDPSVSSPSKPRKESIFQPIDSTDADKFIVELPVSSNVLEGVKYDGKSKDGREFTHMRYTAVTADPDSFVAQDYQVRAKQLGRKTRIAVVVTMYNEPDVLFCKSFRAIMKNISYLCSGKALWSEDSWKEIVVVIVSDGRQKVNPTVLTVLGVLGCYMEGLEKSSVNGKAVQAHMYEFTTQMSVDEQLKTRGINAKDGLTMVPVQTILLIKEKNQKKINSHRWFFNAICDDLEPEICLLIDVGTKPTKESFFHLYKAFYYDPLVGGACGEIAAELGTYGQKALNPLVAVQNFEYKMSNILDKPLESVFGYISVLPGAFSAYRFEALKGEPLKMYFKGEKPHGNDVGEANMYLAEDRILCFELVMKQDKAWLLKYVKSAKAETDVPTELHDLISQRRRWLNGSFFAAVHASVNWMRIFQSRHTKYRKFILLFEFIYNFWSLCFAWFNIGNFYLSFHFLFDLANTTSTAGVDPFYPGGAIVFSVVRAIYLGALVTIFVASLGNRPQASKILYFAVAIIFAAIMILMIFMSIWTIKVSIDVYNATNPTGLSSFFRYVQITPTFRDIVISLMSSYGLYFLSAIIHMEPWHCITCLGQYMLSIPTFVNIFMVYAFCNIHDVSWGTKGDNLPSSAPSVVIQKGPDGKVVAVIEDMPEDEPTPEEKWMVMKKKLEENAKSLRDRNDAGPAPNAQTQQDDYFKQFRTNTVLLWMLSNALLVFFFTSEPIVTRIFPNKSQNTSVNP